MPIIVRIDETKTVRQGEGWKLIALADGSTFGTPAMIARRWVLDPGARGPELTHGDSDQLLYVIRGSGAAEVDGRALALSEESVLWLEPGERYCFVGGDEGLEILQGYAPGDSAEQ